MRRLYRYNRNGFTLIEVILSLSITLTIIFNVYSIVRLVSTKTLIDDNNVDLYIAAKQISEYVMSCNELEVNDEIIEYKSLDLKNVRIYFDSKNRLVKEDGYEIIGTNIDHGSFEVEDELVYMNLERNNKEYRFLIGYVNEEIKDE